MAGHAGVFEKSRLWEDLIRLIKYCAVARGGRNCGQELQVGSSVELLADNGLSRSYTYESIEQGCGLGQHIRIFQCTGNPLARSQGQLLRSGWSSITLYSQQRSLLDIRMPG